MRKKEVKKQLQMSYRIPESDTQRAFLRKYEQRRLQFGSIVGMQMRYMGGKSIGMGLLICVLFYLGYRNGDSVVMWNMSSLIPAAAVVPMELLGRSEKYGMEELEAASRFSLSYVRLVRILIMGIISLFLLVGVWVWQTGIMKMNMVEILLVSWLPYLVNVYGGLLIARVWHAKENAYGIATLSALSCLLSFTCVQMNIVEKISALFIVGLTLLVMAGIVKQSIVYVKRRENLIWNWC